jgi:hypothetical protein
VDAAASGTRELKSDSQGAHAPAERLRGHTRSYVVFSRLPLGAITTTGLSGKAIECFIQNTRFAVAASFDSIRKHVSVPQRSACVFVSRSVVCGFFYAAFCLGTRASTVSLLRQLLSPPFPQSERL